MLCTTFEKRDMHRLQIHFETTPFCHAYTNFICQQKNLEILDELNLLQIPHLYTE